MSSNYPEQFPRTEVKSPHSNEPGVPDDIREVPKVEGLPPLTEDIIETTNKPNTPFEGFGGEKVELEADEKATFDQVRKSVAARYETAEAAPETEKKRLSLKTRIFAALTGVALLAGAGAGIKAMTDGASEPLQPEQTTSGPATPGTQETTTVATPDATPSSIETNSQTNPFEISAGLSDEQLAKNISETLSATAMAGATKETDDNQFTGDNATLTLEEYVAKVVQQQSELRRALFPKNFESNPALLQIFNGLAEANRKNLLNYLTTTGGVSMNPKNIEPWEYTEKYEGLVSANTDGPTRVLVFNSTETNNGDKNLYGANASSYIPTQTTITLTENNGREEITAMRIEKR